MSTWKLWPQGVVRSIVLPFSAWLAREEFFQHAIALIGSDAPLESEPVAVLARVRTAAPRVITPELAKKLLDTLHDRKKLPPHYRDRGVRPVLVDDGPDYVTALGVELQMGVTDSMELVIARTITVSSPVVLRVDVGMAAPNDISTGGPAARARYLRALEDSWPADDRRTIESSTVVVVRHGKQRDEDNTWATWIGSLQAARASARASWAPGVLPLNAAWRPWRPSAIASVRDDSLGARVRYEFYE